MPSGPGGAAAGGGNSATEPWQGGGGNPFAYMQIRLQLQGYGVMALT